MFESFSGIIWPKKLLWFLTVQNGHQDLINSIGRMSIPFEDAEEKLNVHKWSLNWDVDIPSSLNCHILIQ